eukprot:TRINITY_DN22205_c0_g1_i2.p1 TRINITY_DN22205_c0_g1~~TRINITY_DN22205_c0_g1_i2.p1  ORF type:complete len:256 (+),score=15.41 TRINITY_DN22205_c0_g1_i2:127-894(+)
MFTRKPPFSEIVRGVPNDMVLLRRLTQQGGAVPDPPPTMSPAGKDFLRLCFQIKPADRPPAHTLLYHPWLTVPAPSPLSLCPGSVEARARSGNSQDSPFSNGLLPAASNPLSPLAHSFPLTPPPLLHPSVALALGGAPPFGRRSVSPQSPSSGAAQSPVHSFPRRTRVRATLYPDDTTDPAASDSLTTSQGEIIVSLRTLHVAVAWLCVAREPRPIEYYLCNAAASAPQLPAFVNSPGGSVDAVTDDDNSPHGIK